MNLKKDLNVLTDELLAAHQLNTSMPMSLILNKLQEVASNHTVLGLIDARYAADLGLDLQTVFGQGYDEGIEDGRDAALLLVRRGLDKVADPRHFADALDLIKMKRGAAPDGR